MSRARRAVAAVIVGMLALTATACTQFADRSGEGGIVAPGGKLRLTYAPDTRHTVENLSGPSVTDPNHTIDLSDFAGKVVVINVWGSWCGPCRTEAPELEKTYVATKDRGVQFLGINVRETGDDAARDFIDSFKLTFPSISDAPGRTLLAIGDKYPVSVVPMTFVLDRKHRVAAAYLTAVDSTELTSAIDTVLGEG